MGSMTTDQTNLAQAVETANNALSDARRTGDPQAIKVAQQGVVNAQQAQHQGVATLDQHRERSGLSLMPAMPPTERGGIKYGGSVEVREALRVADEERRAAEAADAEAAADDLACGFIEPNGDEECGAEGPLIFRVAAPERGLDALIPDSGVLVCTTHLPAVLCDQGAEDNRAWSVTVVVEPS